MESAFSVGIPPNVNFNIFTLDPILFKYIGSILCHFDIVFCCWDAFDDLRRIVQVALADP